MRLRLHLERNGLPTTQALWSVKDSKSTIAQLLQHINEIFPLESGQWGLEDYKVSVGGFECLHYQILEEILKEDEVVAVKPLQWVDVRSRTVSGRSQISRDGRHMVDGVPFGRNMLVKPVRPDLVIPPRKKRRVMFEEIEDSAQQQLLLGNGTGLEDEDEDENEEMYGDYEGAEKDRFPSHDSSSSSDDDTEIDDTSSSDSDSTGGSDDSSSDDSDDAPSVRTSRTPAEVATPKLLATIPAPLPKTNGNMPATNAVAGNKRKRGASDAGEVEDSTHDAETKSTHSSQVSASQERNHRKRDSKKLKYLKSQGVLDPSATISDFRQWQSGKQMEGARQQLLSAIQAGGVDVTEEPKSRKRAKEEGVITPLEPDEELPAVSETVQQDDEVPEQLTPSTAARRSRLNVSGLERMIYSSLGVRVPKTQEDRDRLQEKLSKRAIRNMPAAEAVEASMNSDQAAAGALSEQANGTAIGVADESHNDNVEAWRSKIDLGAVECSDEGVTLSTPPFPFVQCWDEQYKKKRRAGKVSNKYMAKKGKKTKGGDFYETYDKYNTDGYGDALDYDEAEYPEDEDYWEEGALLDDSYQSEEEPEPEPEPEPEEEDDGFPTLPSPIDLCPALKESEARPNDFITYNELACDESTAWQPVSVNRLAKILKCKESEKGKGKLWVLQMSARDYKARVFDEEGNRIYSKFMMPGYDDGDDGVREVGWGNMGEVRWVGRVQTDG